jgi:putative zinc finger protein
MSADITCASVKDSLALYLYGELSFDDEERVELHLEACAECRAALDREKALHAALDQIEIGPSPSLLRECREDLRAQLDEERSMPRPVRVRWWEGSWLRPAAAFALLAIGFFAARLTPRLTSSEPEASRVRFVEPASGGRVQIVMDETRQRTVSGRPDDQQIRALLLSAAKDPSDPGLRAETVDILNAGAQSAEVRDALVYALRHDQNAGVRLKALEGLKPFAQEPGVRGALEQVLLSDSNPGLRTQAIDLLTVGPAENLDRGIVPTLQELMGREENSYVRERSQQVLHLMKASAQTY